MHVYTAEAYSRRRRFADAMQHLSPQNVGDLSSKGPAASEDAAGEAENLPTGSPAVPCRVGMEHAAFQPRGRLLHHARLQPGRGVPGTGHATPGREPPDEAIGAVLN